MRSDRVKPEYNCNSEHREPDKDIRDSVRSSIYPTTQQSYLIHVLVVYGITGRYLVI